MDRAARRDTALLDRILALDAEAVALHGALSRRQAPPAAPHSIAPRPRGGVARHDWPLADDPDRSQPLTPYDRRPDDPAILAARAGAAFLDRIAGLPPAAAAALLQPESAALDQAAPEVSVVVPVYGQLAWTLNCLDSLLRHDSATRFDIVVVDDASPDATPVVLDTLARRIPALSVVSRPANGGFVAACNAGAPAARGRLLVLLNNDTRVASGWLDALAQAFRLFPRAGLVGSKLLYPDGTLQEAGAIIWRDGSAWNVGRNEDPNQPAHCHARQADYVSGASIAVPAPLWRALGGLDPAFAPAYGEDADLAMRVRAAGHEVWVQPASRVIHYEGRTGGTDTTSGAKAHQIANLKRLYVRWHDRLAGHARPGADPYLERERHVRRRALVVEATTPTPLQDAGSGVAVESIRLLQSMGYKVHFVPQDNFLFEPPHTGRLQAMGVECAYAPFDIGFDDYIARHGALFDVVMVFRPHILARIEAALRRHAPQAAIVFSNADLHFLRMQRLAALTGDPEAAAAAEAMRTTELALIARTPVTMTLSTFERDLLAAQVPEASVVLQPFPYEVVGTAAGFGSRRDILFLGGYGHPPNVDAAIWLVQQVLPLLQAARPDCRVILAGANPTAAVRALAGPSVEVTGLVADLRPLFDAARVFVAPLRVGAGVKGKVIAALAHGLPVVATSCGAEGMEVADGREMLIADGAEAFAASCLRLYDDAALWRGLSLAGLAYVARACSAEAGRRALTQAIDTALRRQLGLSASPGGLLG